MVRLAERVGPPVYYTRAAPIYDKEEYPGFFEDKTLSWYQKLQQLPTETRKEMLERLSNEQRESLSRGDWAWYKRGNQDLHWEKPWRYRLTVAGRGNGKTRSGSEWIAECVSQHGVKQVALIGQTHTDTVATMWNGVSGLKQVLKRIWPDEDVDLHAKYQGRLTATCPNGAEIHVFSAENARGMRGPSVEVSWCDELATWNNPEEKQNNPWEMVKLFTREGVARIIVTTTPRRGHPALDWLQRQHNCLWNTGSTRENTALNPEQVAERYEEYGDTDLAAQELEGILLMDVPGALWTQDMINQYRHAEMPALVEIRRKVVAIDPAGTASRRSDWTGIVAAAIDYDDHMYILESMKVKMSPQGWASAAIDMAERHGVDKLLAERNMGGDMVEHVLTQQGSDIPVTTTYATAHNGKYVRAEPVSILYHRGIVHHVGGLNEHRDLEAQMTAFTNESKNDDLVDPLVYCVTDLHPPFAGYKNFTIRTV